MYLKINNQNLPIQLANTFKTRLIGLLGQKNITKGILFPHCRSIHTLFMRSPIDVIILSSNNEIIAIHENVQPFKIINSSNKKTSILELPPHTSQHLHLHETLLFHDSIL